MTAKKRGLGKGQAGNKKRHLTCLFSGARPDSGRPGRNIAPGMDRSTES